MTVQGQRFELDLGDDDAPAGTSEHNAPIDVFNFVGDVQERTTTQAVAPTPPKAQNAQNGFPTHRKRVAQSRFKKSRENVSQGSTAEKAEVSIPNAHRDSDEGSQKTERQQIDEENRRRMASMSAEEIEQEREELLSSLDPSLIQRLLRRANIDDGNDQGDFPGIEQEKDHSMTKKSKSTKKVTFAANEDNQDKDAALVSRGGNVAVAGDFVDEGGYGEDSQLDEGQAASLASLSDSSIHFPRAPQPPDLDPSSPSFLTELHEKYFPSLPADPSKLEWMTSSSADQTYSANQSGLDPKDIRFSFKGTLIPPKLAAQIPVTEGLHHHGNAPDAAGYTIPELAMLARSSVAAQRCIALQTLGRVLYRLGKGEFGDPGDGGQGTVGAEDTFGELARGLWSEVEREGVIEICVSESEGEGVAGGRHASARAYATEAVWLWQKGGGRRLNAA